MLWVRVMGVNVQQWKEQGSAAGARTCDSRHNLSACCDQYIIPLHTQFDVAAAGHHG